MGLFATQKVTMKVLFIAATLALASAGFAPSCEECNAAAAGLLARLTSAESIEEQTGILISQVCPQAVDAAACEAALLAYWGDMANCLYPAFIGAGDACERLGLVAGLAEPAMMVLSAVLMETTPELCQD